MEKASLHGCESYPHCGDDGGQNEDCGKGGSMTIRGGQPQRRRPSVLKTWSVASLHQKPRTKPGHLASAGLCVPYLRPFLAVLDDPPRSDLDIDH